MVQISKEIPFEIPFDSLGNLDLEKEDKEETIVQTTSEMIDTIQNSSSIKREEGDILSEMNLEGVLDHNSLNPEIISDGTERGGKNTDHYE